MSPVQSNLMKKYILLLPVLFLMLWGNAQETIFANESHTMTLFFPSPIRQAVTGSDNFTFSYNRESAQHFGLLQANMGGNSNLLVITEDGQVYSYSLSYRKQLPESHRFVQIGESIGRETKTQVLSPEVFKKIVAAPTKSAPENKRLEIMGKGAEYVLSRKSNVLRTKRKKGLVLRLKELFYHGDEVYVEMEVQNNSNIDFELDTMWIYKVNGKNGRRSSHQKMELEPIYIHDKLNKIRVGQRLKVVYVLHKFTLGDSERLLVELHEDKGARELRLFWK